MIYYSGAAPAQVTKNLPKDARQERFDFPKQVFAFLDSLVPGNSKNSLKLLDSLVKTEPVELVFHLLSRHLRDLYWASISPETLALDGWRKKKLSDQANQFSIFNFQFLINTLSEIDVKTKTSDSHLKTELDLWMIKSLK